jgi:hypothetical protein
MAPANSTPVGPPPMTTKFSIGMGAGLYHLPLRQLKGEQHAAPDLGCIFDRLQPRRVLRPLILAEVGMGGAGAQDEVVVFDLAPLPEARGVVGFDVHHFVHQDFDIFLFGKDGANGLGNVCRGKHGQATW